MSFSPPPIRPSNLLRRFWTDDRGMIVSAELMIIMTIGVLALVTGVSTVTSALNFEYTDIANALTGLNQSYNISGHYAGTGGGGTGGGGSGAGSGGSGYHAFNRGMGFNDRGNSFVATGVQASVAGSFHQSVQGFIETNAVAANAVVATEALALVEESALLVEEAAEVEVEADAVVETEAELEERLRLLEAEAAKLEATQFKVRATSDCPDGCPLDELQELENRIRRLRMCLEHQNVFDCDRR